MKRTFRYSFIRCIWKRALFLCALVMGSSSLHAQQIWECTSGPDGGNVKCIYEDPWTHDLFVGAFDGGIWISHDFGDSWEFFGLASHTVLSIATNERGDIFAGTDHWRAWRSLDGGDTWNQCFDRNGLACVVVVDSIVVFGSDTGIRRSTDYGDTWLRPPDMIDYDINSSILLSDSTILAGADEGIFRSADLGETWEQIDATLTTEAFAEDSVYIYAACENGVYRSDDGGDVWEGPLNLVTHYDGVGVGIDSTVYSVSGANGVYRSFDHGDTWEEISQDIQYRTEFDKFLAASNGDIFTFVNFVGLFRATPPDIEWRVSDSGLAVSMVNDLDFSPDGTLWAARSLTSTVYSEDHGQTWQEAEITGYQREIGINPENGDILVACSDSFAFSTDNGQSWEVYPHYPARMVVDDVLWAFECWWIATFDGVFRSDDNGISWNCVAACEENSHIFGIELTPAGTLVAVGLNRVFRSVNQGTTWDTQEVNLGWLGDLASSTDSYLYAVTDSGPSGVLISPDDGVTWTLHEMTVPDINQPGTLRSVAVNSSGHIFIGTEVRGIFLSVDHGQTWEPFREGIRHTVWPAPQYLFFPTIRKILFDENGYAYFSTNGSCVYRSTEPLSGDNPIATTTIPSQLVLHQNYPNPFNSITTLTLSLPGVSDVNVSLYDVTGRYVKHIAQHRMVAGEHALQVDAAGLPSGIYFVKANAGEYAAVRKVVLVK